MEHRHLTPHEFDLLVDGEEGFGVAPLRAHVDQCAACRQELEAQTRVVEALESLPHFSPSPLFAYRVMREVQVFEPWHVAAANTVRRFVPRTRPARALAAGVAGLVATSLTAGSLWLASRLDAVALFAGIGFAELQDAGTRAVASVVGATMGSAAAAPGGGASLTVAAGGLLAAVAVAAFGLRALAAASRRRRM